MIKVRVAEIEDISQIYAIELEAFTNDPWSEEALRSELAHEDAVVAVIEEDDVILGYGAIRIIFDEGHVMTMAVKFETRGRGLGSRLLSCLIELAEADGAEIFTLEVRESNVAAINLYKKLGFEIEGKRKGYYHYPKEDAIIMWKK